METRARLGRLPGFEPFEHQIWRTSQQMDEDMLLAHIKSRSNVATLSDSAQQDVLEDVAATLRRASGVARTRDLRVAVRDARVPCPLGDGLNPSASSRVLFFGPRSGPRQPARNGLPVLVVLGSVTTAERRLLVEVHEGSDCGGDQNGPEQRTVWPNNIACPRIVATTARYMGLRTYR